MALGSEDGMQLRASGTRVRGGRPVATRSCGTAARTVPAVLGRPLPMYIHTLPVIYAPRLARSRRHHNARHARGYVPVDACSVRADVSLRELGDHPGERCVNRLSARRSTHRRVSQMSICTLGIERLWLGARAVGYAHGRLRAGL